MNRRTGSLFITLLLVLFALAGQLSADEDATTKQLFVPLVYHQSPCQTIVKAGQSIQTAVNNAKSGQTICVRAGTYHERVDIKPSQSGITLMAYPGERPIIDGKGTIPVPTANNQYLGLIQITGSNVIVDGFDVRNSAIRGVNVYQSSTSNVPQENVIVRNMIVSGSKDMGVTVKGHNGIQPRNVLIANSVIHTNNMKFLSGNVAGAGLVFVDVKNSISRGNHIYHNYGEGLIVDRWSNGITVEDSVIYDNERANLYLIRTTNPLIQRNLVFCTDDAAYWSGTGDEFKPGVGLQIRDEDFGNASNLPLSSGQVIINNIVVGCGANFGVASQVPGGGLNNALVANNSFINARGKTGEGVNNIEFEGRASFKNTQFLNNLILQATPGTNVRIQYSLGTPDLSSFTLANNLYNVPPHNSWPTNEANRIIANPLIANPVMPLKGSIPDVNSYRIPTGSPAINAGKPISNVIVDFFQQPRAGAPDIGADEMNN
jgi:hypothetical protein